MLAIAPRCCSDWSRPRPRSRSASRCSRVFVAPLIRAELSGTLTRRRQPARLQRAWRRFGRPVARCRLILA